MVRIRDTDVRRCLGGDVGNDVVVDFAVIRIQAQVDLNVRVQRFKPFDGVLVNGNLGHVGVVLRPERDFVLLRFIKFFGNIENLQPFGAMAACQGKQADKQIDKQKPLALLSHPFVPPLATPAMIFCRKIRNRTISGTEIETTAAIMAGMFSRPNPLSRIAWMPLDTRK